MAVVSKTELKQRFQSKDKPSQKDYEDLIDSGGVPGGPAGGDFEGNFPNPTLKPGSAPLQVKRTAANGTTTDWQRPHLVLVNQTGHGFAVGDALFPSGTNAYTKAIATAANTAQLVFVFEVVDANNFILTSFGYVPISTANHETGAAFVAGTTYFLSASVAGKLTDMEPIASGQVSVRCLLVSAPDKGFILNNRPAIAAINSKVIRGLYIRILETVVGSVLNVSSNQVNIQATEAVLRNPSGQEIYFANINVTNDKATVGAGGRSSAFSVNANTGYYIWLVSNGSSVSSIIDASNTSPTMPGGYTYKVLVGLAATDTGSTNWLYIHEYGDRVKLVSCAITPPATWSTDNSGKVVKQFIHRLSRLPSSAEWRIVRKATTNGADGNALAAEIAIADTDSSGSADKTLCSFMTATDLALILAAGVSNNVRVVHPTNFGKDQISDDDYNVRVIAEL